MAEFLIKKADSETNKAGSYKAGDIVFVYEDGMCKEPPAPNGAFYIVKVPSLSKELAEKYVKAETDGFIVTEFMPINHRTNPMEASEKIVRRRAFNLDLSLIPNKAKNTLLTTGWITVTKNQALSYIRNKKTNSTEM